MAWCIFIIKTLIVLSSPTVYSECLPTGWTRMTMEQILLKSDIVVYGNDTMHENIRNPNVLDGRFDVYCVLKKDQFKVPGELIIESIDEQVYCYPVHNQTTVGEEYILGLTRMSNGDTRYAKVNPGQKSAFTPSTENFNTLARMCKLGNWNHPATGDKGNCPPIPTTSRCNSITTSTTTPAPKKSFWDSLFGTSAGSRATLSLALVALGCIGQL